MKKNTFFKNKNISSCDLAEFNKLIYSWHEIFLPGWIKKNKNMIHQTLVDPLERAFVFMSYLSSAEVGGFRNKEENKTLHDLLYRVLFLNETVTFFGILCPSYRKGDNVVGFADFPGNTTYRAFHNINQMKKFAISLGCDVSVIMFYSNISLERYDLYGPNDLSDMYKNILHDSIIAKSLGVPFKTLTDFDPRLGVEVGYAGRHMDPDFIPVSKSAMERSFWRDKKFYPENFGWSTEEARERTICHAHSYYWQGVAVRDALVNPVMVYSAYDYEKGGLYTGERSSLLPVILYPKKDHGNTPYSNLPSF